MKEFELYEDATYGLDRAARVIDKKEDQRVAELVVQSYRKIEDTSVNDETDIRAYIESIIGSINSGKNGDAKKYIIELRNVISRYQKKQISSVKSLS